MRCTGKSDIDLVVKLKEECISDEMKNSISEKIQAACDWNADIVWRDRLHYGFLRETCSRVQRSYY